MHRVSGMGEKNSAKLSAQGLTVNGADYKGSGASQTAKVKPNEKSSDKSSDKPADKTADKAADKNGDKSKSAKS